MKKKGREKSSLTPPLYGGWRIMLCENYKEDKNPRGGRENGSEKQIQK